MNKLKFISLIFLIFSNVVILGQVEIFLRINCRDEPGHFRQKQKCLQRTMKWFNKIQEVKLISNTLDTGPIGKINRNEKGYSIIFEHVSREDWADTTKKIQPESHILFEYDSSGNKKIVFESHPPLLTSYVFPLVVRRKCKWYYIPIPIYAVENDTLVTWIDDLKNEWLFMIVIRDGKIYKKVGKKVILYLSHKQAGIASTGEIRKFKRKFYNLQE